MSNQGFRSLSARFSDRAFLVWQIKQTSHKIVKMVFRFFYRIMSQNFFARFPFFFSFYFSSDLEPNPLAARAKRVELTIDKRNTHLDGQ